MDEHTQGVMVALRPITSDWATVPMPHLTLVYAGEKSELNPFDFSQLAKDTASIAMENSLVQLATDGLDVFGEGLEKVEVIKLKANPTLMRMRQRVVSWNKSVWPFNPHVTIGPVGTFKVGMPLPPAIAFDQVMLNWGEDELNFWLKPYTGRF